MAQATFSIRMDEQLKQQFDLQCADFGMTASTAFSIFAKTVVREKKIPFEISSTTADAGYKAFLALRAEALQNGLQNMSLEDINDEIQQTRCTTKED